MGTELVFDCVMHLNPDLNSVVSSVCKKYYQIDSFTRKEVTVHVHYLPDPSRLSLRFPNLESLTVKSYSYGGDKSCSYARNSYHSPKKCSIQLTPWIQEIAKLDSLKSLSIRNMVVSTDDLKCLAKTLGASLRSLEIRGCKIFSVDGLNDIARCCVGLRSLRLEYNALVDHCGWSDGGWLHELALCNEGVMESIALNYPFVNCDVPDFELLAKKCSKSLVSLNAIDFSLYLDNFKGFFEHANKLEHFGYVAIDEGWKWDCSDFRFPQNIGGLGIIDWRKDSFPFLPRYLHQLRELDLKCKEFGPKCQCYLFERCPNLEVLHTKDICGDKGLEVIGRFCKKLRKLKHGGKVTHLGLIDVAQGCPSLEYLEVSILDISNEALACVGTHLRNLRDFRISWGSEDGTTNSPIDNGVQAMLMGCNKLERLDLGLCDGGLTDVGLRYVGKYGHNLRSLFLRHTGESDVGLRELLKGCPKLRKLKLNGYPFKEPAMSRFVFSTNQSIRYVWLEYGSPDVSVLTRPMVSAERNAYRRGNGGQDPRGDGSYHHNYAGKVDQNQGRHNQEWNLHRNYNNRYNNMQPQRSNNRRGAYMRPAVHNSAPFVHPPMPFPMRQFGNNVMYPDVGPAMIYVQGPAPFVGPFPAPVYYSSPDPVALLHTNIVRQIDYYFSKENLVKDTYLRSNMDEQGWVSVSLIASFKKVKALTNNVGVIIAAMRQSTVVEVQDNKIRRRNDWMKWLYAYNCDYSSEGVPRSLSQDSLTSRLQGTALDEASLKSAVCQLTK